MGFHQSSGFLSESELPFDSGKESLSNISPGEQIKIDIPSEVSLPVPSLQKTRQVLGTRCFSYEASPKLTHEERKIFTVSTRGTQVVVDVPDSASLHAPSMHTNSQALSSSNCSCGHSQFYQEKENISNFPGEQTTIVILHPASSLCKLPQVLHTRNSSVESSKDVTDDDVADRDQTNGYTSNSGSLVHQPLIEGQETSSFHIENPISLLPEAQQTTSGIGNGSSGGTSQNATEIADGPTQDPDLKIAVKVALLVIPISVGGIFSVVAGLIGDKRTNFTHTVLFMAFASLSYISFFSGVVLFLLALIPLRFPGLVMTLKITMWVTLGSITYAIDCATCIILLNSLVEVILLLVAPVPVVSVLIILRFSSRRT